MGIITQESLYRLVEAGLDLGSDLPLEPMAQRIVKLAISLSQANAGALLLLDEAGQPDRLITVGIDERTREQLGSLLHHMGLQFASLRDARATHLLFPNNGSIGSGTLPHQPVCSPLLAFPIRCADRLLGILCVMEKERTLEPGSLPTERFSKEDDPILGIFATQAALAIRSANHAAVIDQRAERLEAINRLSRAISSTSKLDAAFESFAQETRSLIPYHRMELLAREGEQFRMAWSVVASPLASREPSAWSRTEGTAMGWVLAHHTPHLAPDLTLKAAFEDERCLAQEGVRCSLLQPLITQGQAVGVLRLDSCTAYSYGERELEIFAHVSGELALAIQNGLLMEAQRRATSQLESTVDELKRTQEALLKSEKLRAIGQLAAGVAHDFNNLLNAIIGFSELALRETAATGKGQRYLGLVAKLSRQAAGLIGQLLSFARVAPLDRKPLDLNLLLRETGKMLQRTLPETITIRVEPCHETLSAIADVAQMQQIILNLATNARDAMPRGGTLALRLNPVTLTEANLGSHPERRLGAFARLTVADTGTGIPTAIRDRIFEPFFTTKEPGHGTGLGLASVHGIVHQHEGWLDVETAEGQGTAFHVFLPLRLVPIEGATFLAPEALPRGRESLLLVEDSPMVLELEEILLSELGYTVLTAVDGVEALAAFRAHPDIALVLTDAILPRMGAADLIPALRALNPDIKVLVATGYAPDEICHTLDHLAVSGYVRKPFGQSDLAVAVRAAIDGEGPNYNPARNSLRAITS